MIVQFTTIALAKQLSYAATLTFMCYFVFVLFDSLVVLVG